MDLSLSHSQEMLKNEARNVVQREFTKEVLLKLDETDTGYAPELWQGMADMGWLGMAIPEQYGGTGSSLTDAGVLFEELGRGPVPGPLFSSGILGSLIVMEAGSEEHKKQVLPAVAQGKQILALALTEQTYGWEPEAVHMTAKAGRGGFVLDGMKLFVQDAVGATHLICAARTGRGADSAKNITLFLVDKLAPGVSVRPLPGFVAQAGEVKFESVALPQSSVLGAVGEGWPALERAIEKATPVLCAYKVGACQALFESSVAYSQTRVQFGVPIGRFQRVADHIINIANDLDAARLTTYEALWKLDTGKPATASVHVAKAVSSEAYHQACTSTHFVHGGIGYSREFGLVLHTKMSRTLYHQLGDPRYHQRRLARILGF